MTAPTSIIDRPGAERRLLEDVVARAGRDRPRLDVLEAGCGAKWSLAVPDVTMHITGVDTDAEALRIRRATYADVDREIVGDLREVAIPCDSFDLVYCAYVLEHVRGAELVLNRLADALRPGGRLVIRVPDGSTVYGFAVRHSPHRVHVLYKRYVEGYRHAGRPGHAPYPAVYDPVVSLSGLRDWAAQRGLDVEHEYAVNTYLSLLGRAAPLARLVVRAMAWASRGRLAGTHNNLGFVLRRPPV